METLNNLIRIVPAKGNESFQACQCYKTVSLFMGRRFFFGLPLPSIHYQCDRFHNVYSNNVPFQNLA